MQEELPPPAYSQLEGAALNLNLPAVPTHAPTSPPNHDRLPSIHALALPDVRPHHHGTPHARDFSPRSHYDQSQFPAGTLPPPNGVCVPRGHDASTPRDIGSPMDTASIASGTSPRDTSTRGRATSAVSVDDPDVRLAAEALSGLGNPDFGRSPSSRTLPLPATASDPPPPLLSLITSNHPWLGGTINGSINAYNATKGFSPRFVKYGAELIERNIGSPVVNTVSSVGRRTGVEKNLRRYLGEHRRPSDFEESSDSARKRIRVATASETETLDHEPSYGPPRTRLGSQSSYAESLPAYEADHRSPSYEESTVMASTLTGKEPEPRSGSAQDRRLAWSTQLIMTTSGLGVALSDKSLNSLKYCLGYLRTATKHIDLVMHSLKLLLDEYDDAQRRQQSQSPTNGDGSGEAMEVDGEDEVRRIAEKMKTASSDIWKTLQQVVQSVSNYTGGALPQNASQVVRTQLLSVPQRWASATQSTSAQGEQQGDEVRGAQRMLAFAKEGLDMMGQITTVVDGTVQSAETWLGRMGRRPQESGSPYAEGEKQGLDGMNGIPPSEGPVEKK